MIFFSICKTIIKGGFNEDKLKKLKNNENICLANSTKLIKYNNFIIQEYLIMNNYSNKAASIFTY